MTGSKNQISLKRFVFFVGIAFILPLLLFLTVYTVYTAGRLNYEIAKTNEYALYLFEKPLEKELSALENSMVGVIANNSDYQDLKRKQNMVDAHVGSLRILNIYQDMLNTYDMVSAMYIYTTTNQLYRGIYSRDFTGGINAKEKIESFLLQTIQGPDSPNRNGWFVSPCGDTNYLFRFLGQDGTYCICVIDMDALTESHNRISGEEKGTFILTTRDNTILNKMDWAGREGIQIIDTDEIYYLTGKKRNYFAVQNSSVYLPVKFVYLTDYQGVFYNLDFVQLLLFAMVIFLCLLIPVFWLLFRSYVFSPLDKMIRTMNQIRAGNLDAKMEDSYRNPEFEEVTRVFNQMIEEIRKLRIDAYEKQIEVQRAKMQYLQIQIRPHFFLNCLKNIFGMAQQEKYQEIQNMTITLSRHLRYMFRDSSVLVTLSDELKSIENYVELTKLTSPCFIQYKTEIDEKLLLCRIPPISILSFVENSMKHAWAGNDVLNIHIKAILLEGEEPFANFTVTDNGKGFSENLLEELNAENDDIYSGEHIGIVNVKHRLKLLYNGKAEISFYNLDKGACVDIFLPVL